MKDIPLLNRTISFFLDFIYIFLERGEGKEKEGEKHPCVAASHVPPTGGPTRPATQACALTGKGTRNPLIHRPVLNPLSGTR